MFYFNITSNEKFSYILHIKINLYIRFWIVELDLLLDYIDDIVFYRYKDFINQMLTNLQSKPQSSKNQFFSNCWDINFT